jgi:hypothetical protein
MAKEAEEIIADWRKKRPPTVPRKEVEIVVTALFPDTHRYTKKTSHWLIVEDEDLKQAERLGYHTGTYQGFLTLCLTNGKRLKSIWLTTCYTRLTPKGR